MIRSARSQPLRNWSDGDLGVEASLVDGMTSLTLA